MILKRTILILLLGTCSSAVSAQNNNKVQVPVNRASAGVVKIDVVDSPVIITGFDESTVEFEAIPDDPAKRKGFEDLIFDVLKSGNDVIISAHQRRSKDINVTIKIPKHFSVEVKTVYGSKVQIENVSGSISVNAHAGDIILMNVPGSLDLYSATGDIEVRANSLSGEIPSMITNVYGNIKLILPPAIKATLTINSFSKKINSEFDLKNHYKEVQGDLQNQGVTKSINGGGPIVTLRLHSGTLSISKDDMKPN